MIKIFVKLKQNDISKFFISFFILFEIFIFRAAGGKKGKK